MHRLHVTGTCMQAMSFFTHACMAQVVKCLKNKTIAIRSMSTTKQPDSNTKEKDTEEQGKRWSSRFTAAKPDMNLNLLPWGAGQDRMKVKIYCG